MENYQDKLFPYAYNILGSSEDAKEAVQDVLEKYFSTKKAGIENPKGYLIKAVINQSINIKQRKQRISSKSIWLPEPIATESSDDHLHSEDIIAYSMLVLLEAQPQGTSGLHPQRSVRLFSPGNCSHPGMHH